MKKTLCLLLALTFPLSACIGDSHKKESVSGGTDEISSSGTDARLLAISSTIPAKDASNIDVNSIITATFTVPIDASTINQDTFFVELDDKKIPGEVTYDSNTNTATFTPSSNLGLYAKYKVTLTTGVKDNAGNPLSENYVSNFTTRDGIWNTKSELIENESGEATLPKIAIDSFSNIFVLWDQSEAQDINIFGNRYKSGEGWIGAVPIGNRAGNASNPDIEFDSFGNAFAAWSQVEGQQQNVWIKQYKVGEGWMREIQMNGTNVNAMRPCVAIDGAGNAMVVWRQSDGTQENVGARYYKRTSGWLEPKSIERHPGYTGAPKVVFDTFGNAISVWNKIENGQQTIRTNRFSPENDWGNDEVVGKSSDVSAYQIAVDSSGNAIVVWQQLNGAQNIMANHFSPDKGWTGVKKISKLDGNSSAPQIAMRSNGDAVVVWQQQLNGKQHVYASYFKPGNEWSVASQLDSGHGDSSQARVAFDSFGNAMAIWQKLNATQHIWVNRYKFDQGWGEAQEIENLDGVASDPDIAIDPLGKAIAAWQQCKGPNFDQCDIYINRFE